MKNIEKRFCNYLDNIKFPTEEKKEKEGWNVSGILKKYSNQLLKFDVRDMQTLSNGLFGKYSKSNSKADKIVFETKTSWLVVDHETLFKYAVDKKTKTVYLDDIIKNLEWNIKIDKNEY